jgi:hypothetical protein
VAVIQNLLDVQHTLSPGYNIDWDQILVELARSTSTILSLMRLLQHSVFSPGAVLPCGSAQLGVKHFQQDMSDNWMSDEDNDFNRDLWRNETLTKLEYY